MSIAFGLHVNMNSFTSLQFDGRKLVSALYRISQGTGTILVVVKQGKTVKQSVLVPAKRARGNRETVRQSVLVPAKHARGNRKTIKNKACPRAAELVPANAIPVKRVQSP